MSGKICQAISGHSLLAFNYEGQSRVVEPHCHGTSRAGNEVLRAYQVRGGSNSGEPTGWKMFAVDQIGGLQIVADHFASSRPGYNPNDKGMTSIHCHL